MTGKPEIMLGQKYYCWEVKPASTKAFNLGSDRQIFLFKPQLFQSLLNH
jgi:hypothetical protein